MLFRSDLRQGYLQVPLHPDSRNLIAVVTHAGVVRYTRVPFGLCSAPSCFQKIMSTIFAGIPGVVIFLDDIVVHGSTPAIHNQRPTQVLDTLASHALTLNGEKCIFSASEVEFVGFRLTPEGLSPLHSNVEAIQWLPMPSSPAHIASFLGMTAYYLRFLPQYSSTTAPLRLLLKKNAQWAWTPASKDAVMQLKAQLIAPPVLAHFDPPSPTLVTCHWLVMPPTTQWGLCCLSFTMAQSGLLLLPPELLIQQSRSTPWGRERPWPVSAHVSGGICMCMAVHSHYVRTTKSLQPCLPHLVLGTGLCASTAGMRDFTSTISHCSSHQARECGGGLTVTLHATSSCGADSRQQRPGPHSAPPLPS